MCPRALAPPDPGCVPDNVYFVGSMTPLIACGRGCFLSHDQVYMSPARLAARVHPNRSLLPLMGWEDWSCYGTWERGVDYFVRDNRVRELPIRRRPWPGQKEQTWQQFQSRYTQQQSFRLLPSVPILLPINPFYNFPLHPVCIRLGPLSLYLLHTTLCWGCDIPKTNS